MELNEIKELIIAFENSDCNYFKMQRGDLSIKLKKGNFSKEVIKAETNHSDTNKKAEVKRDDEITHIVKAPLVGIYYDSPNPDADTYVSVGDIVKKGQVLCLIEAMKMMNEVVAPLDGVITEVFQKNQDIVEYETPLFAIGEKNV